MECDIFPFSALTLLVWRQDIWPVKSWFVGGDNLTNKRTTCCHHHFHHPLLQQTPANPGSPGKWPLKRRQRIHHLSPQSC